MTERIVPGGEAGVLDAVRWALDANAPLEVLGAGSKRGFGRPVQAAATLDMSGLGGILLHEPDELVMTALPGTPMVEIEAALAAAGQQLAFEPPDLGPLFGGPWGAGTIGGVFSAGLSGPRRIAAGAARDHLLGAAAVTGRGELVRTGGRVVKNVTGYDLPKLLTGAFGTLGVLTSLTFKVLPRPETAQTLLILGLEDGPAVAALSAALQSPYEVSGAAHLPPGLAARSAALDSRGAAVTAVRLEGVAPSVAYRIEHLAESLAGTGDLRLLDAEGSAVLWAEIAGVAPLFDAGDIVWRVSVAPADGPKAAAAIGGRRYFDWGGGLLWIAPEPEADAGAARVRAAVAALGGHATLMRASDSLRAAVPVFQPQPPPLAALTARVKDSFDPHRLLNPGRMTAGL